MLTLYFLLAISASCLGDKDQTEAVHRQQAFLNRLQHSLLQESGYNKYMAPMNEDLSLVDVEVKFIIYPYSSLNIKEETVWFSGFILTTWTDRRLSWNPAEYGNLSQISLPQSYIWKPDVVIFDKDMNLSGEVFDNEYNLLEVSHSGKVEWQYIYAADFLCTVSLSKYPFDSNTCSVSVTSWVSDRSYRMVSNVSFAQIPFTNRHGELEVNINSVYCGQFPYAFKTTEFCVVTIDLTRRPLSILLNIFIPITLLSILCTISFLLSPDNPEKMNLTINSLLSVIVFLSNVANTLPHKANEISALSVYISLLVCHDFLAVVGNVVILILVDRIAAKEDKGHHSEQVSQGQSQTAHVSTVRIISGATSKQEMSGEKQGKGGNRKRSNMDYKMNRCFFLLSSTTLVFNLIWFCIQSQ